MGVGLWKVKTFVQKLEKKRKPYRLEMRERNTHLVTHPSHHHQVCFLR